MLVELVPHMLDQVGLKVRKHQFGSQMCLLLKNACETSQCLIVNRWRNDVSDSVDKEVMATATSFACTILMASSMTPENAMVI
jgi:hypothetical protein